MSVLITGIDRILQSCRIRRSDVGKLWNRDFGGTPAEPTKQIDCWCLSIADRCCPLCLLIGGQAGCIHQVEKLTVAVCVEIQTAAQVFDHGCDQRTNQFSFTGCERRQPKIDPDAVRVTVTIVVNIPFAIDQCLQQLVQASRIVVDWKSRSQGVFCTAAREAFVDGW